MPAPNTTRVYYSTDGVTYTEVPLPCISISPPQGQTEDIPRRHLNQSGNLAKTSPGEREVGEVSMSFEYDTRTAAKQDFFQLLLGWWVAATDPLYWRITYPKPTGLTTPGKDEFTAYVKRQPAPNVPENGRMTLDIVLKQNSETTNTDAA